MSPARYPLLYQINTRVWLAELSRKLGRRATLDDIPDVELDRFAAMGFDWIWLLSVWQTGAAVQAVSRSNSEWRAEFERTLFDLTDDDIPGSGFAITSYTVHRDLGGDTALARVRERLRQRGLKLMLDFVPNHMAPDHPWVEEHPDYFIAGNEEDLAIAPQNYFRTQSSSGSRIFAYGCDPYFSGWPDTIQLNYGNPALQKAMIGELTRIAGQCDGVRCDMAMLVLPDVFERTNKVVENVALMMRPDAAAFSCEVQVSLSENLPLVTADPVQMQQVLVNLVSNAFHAMSETPIARRKVEIATQPDGHGFVRVVVRDHGAGISDDEPERLFEHFYTTKRDGLGMGLAIVRSIVEAHGGKIAARNAESGGALFEFELPVNGHPRA